MFQHPFKQHHGSLFSDLTTSVHFLLSLSDIVFKASLEAYNSDQESQSVRSPLGDPNTLDKQSAALNNRESLKTLIRYKLAAPGATDNKRTVPDTGVGGVVELPPTV